MRAGERSDPSGADGRALWPSPCPPVGRTPVALWWDVQKLIPALGQAQDLPLFSAPIHYHQSDWARPSPEAALGLRNSDRSGHAWYSSVRGSLGPDRGGPVLVGLLFKAP